MRPATLTWRKSGSAEGIEQVATRNALARVEIRSRQAGRVERQRSGRALIVVVVPRPGRVGCVFRAPNRALAAAARLVAGERAEARKQLAIVALRPQAAWLQHVLQPVHHLPIV